MSLGQEGECGGPSGFDVENLRGWADDDCGRAGVVILAAADAIDDLERRLTDEKQASQTLAKALHLLLSELRFLDDALMLPDKKDFRDQYALAQTVLDAWRDRTT